jgi:hypothetical protein
MPKKLTIVIPDTTYNKLESLKKVLDLPTLSGTASLSIEILNWVVSKNLDNFQVKAEKTTENRTEMQECPLILPEPKTPE